MEEMRETPPVSHRRSRRNFLGISLTLPAAAVLAACVGRVTTGSQPAATASPTTVTGALNQSSPTALPTVAAASTPPAPTAAPATATPGPPAASPAAVAQAPVLTPTPAVCDDDDLTPAQTEGPYYTPNTPERSSLLEPGLGGTKLVLTGQVLTPDCRPVPRALLDFWQADDLGQYDNQGHRLRGHQFTDANGFYRLETIMPGLYPGRTRHIHVKVQTPNEAVLTTQLYFPDEAGNAGDRIFNPDLVVTLAEAPDGQAAHFNFVRPA